MTSQSSATAGLKPGTNCGTLLVITSEKACAAHAELARHLSSLVDAHSCPLGADTRADLATILSGNPPHVVAVPLSLGLDDPLLTDLTGLLRWARTRWPATTFLQSSPFGTPQHVVGWASRQARAALGHSPGPVPTAGTALLVVGAGGVPAANAEVCAIARLLGETHDYDLVEAAFARDARPTVGDGIDRLARLGARRVVVLPLSLLDDPMYQAVRAQVATAFGPDVVLARPLLTPGAVAAVARRRYEDARARWSLSGDDGLSPAHGHGPEGDPARGSDDILPPRYRGGQAVSSARMRSSAPLTYDAEGRVAWDRVWRGFCHLALAGGPPHRGKLLEPSTKEEVLADPDAAARVAAEIARGLSLVTRLPTVTDAAPGWVGLVCPDEEMAVWLLRAIVVENVSVRREGTTLFLPTGPAYRVEKEIKNVITAVAKTHHYWTEHRAAR
jgi:sirohydrochlorin cobaltochelatase